MVFLSVVRGQLKLRTKCAIHAKHFSSYQFITTRSKTVTTTVTTAAATTAKLRLRMTSNGINKSFNT